MSDRLRKYLTHFIELTDLEWQALEQQLTIKTINKKDFLVQKGQKTTQIGFLLSGSCRVFYEKDGEEWTTYFCFENSLVAAYLSCITGQPSTLSIQALEDCQLLLFDYQTLTALYQQFPVYETFGRKLAEYLFMGLDVRLAEQLILSPEERYLKFLGSPAKRKIIERIPQQYIASYLGITPVSLSRIRRRIIPV
ncbi:Crp/Fnr family transcriptional regulator [Spirosoma utsteinense]|uniref:CRP-like cAMP-binding protein n=1 Tax=Spirosoma utsteinense TaxID=2585773 RepID=A0ABR6WFD5_9BACT|nr:Crp/Fnr family transcriptional regulator [Spirosoma utsteinense]MBC3789420.1 CRP-like cAMP-binding protein [Spirosoma utsteinense]MBC3795260.1 CRP-like cAMP-binding protein [Spirosoma utsteinense]